MAIEVTQTGDTFNINGLTSSHLEYLYEFLNDENEVASYNLDSGYHLHRQSVVDEVTRALRNTYITDFVPSEVPD